MAYFFEPCFPPAFRPPGRLGFFDGFGLGLGVGVLGRPVAVGVLSVPRWVGRVWFLGRGLGFIFIKSFPFHQGQTLL